MCFSATASFVAGTALSTVGVATIKMSSTKRELPFAAVPLFFGVQQLIEGMIWLSFRGESLFSNQPLTVLYSFFSHVFWPIYVPFAIWLLEKNPVRRRLLMAIQVAGLTTGIYLLYSLIQFSITSNILGKHIVYDTPHFYIVPVMFLYLLSTCASGMLSSNKMIQIFGALSLVTFIAAYIIHAATFISVWCFFAAVISLIVYFYFRQNSRGFSGLKQVKE